MTENEIETKEKEINARIEEIQKEISKYTLTKDCSGATIKHLERRLKAIKKEISDLEDFIMVNDFLQYGAGGKDPE